MKTLLIPTVLGSALLFAGCASYEHHHDGDAMPHGHSQDQAMAGGHHQAMMGEHHGSGHNMGHGDHGAGHHHDMMHGQSLAGRPGTEDEVDRIIKVKADDSMRFMHEPIKVKTGETIKFEITNNGEVKHEFSIGTKDEHMAHGKMMMANPDMHHGPGGASITIAPGKTETLIWYFEEAWEVEAACNIPGHYQAGMHSPVMFDQ